MRSKVEPLKRLRRLYATVEEMRAVELQRASALLHEAQSAVDAEANAAFSARYHGRQAIASGDRLGWAAAEARREAAGWKGHRLEAVRSDRARVSDAAKEEFVASRMKAEQMRRISANAAEQVAREDEKKLQAATDDRFLARKKWKNKRDEKRGSQRMKAS